MVNESTLLGGIGEAEDAAVFELTGPPQIWHVASGRVDVFGVRLENGAPISRRRHVARFHEGAFLFSTGEAPAPFALIAVPTLDAEVRRLDGGLLAAPGWSNETAGLLVNRIDSWIEQLAAGIFAEMPPKQHVEPGRDGSLLIEAGAYVRSTAAPAWLHHQEGRSLLMGREDLPVGGDDGRYVPVGRNVWILTAEVADLASAGTAERLEDGGLRGDLDAFHASLLKALEAIDAEDRRREVLRLEEKGRADRAALNGALSHLATVMTRADLSVVSDSDATVAACRLVAEASGISLKIPAATPEQGRDRLGQIARASRFRTRKVALRGDWWKRDAGPLLGLLVSDDDDTRSPVALLPGKSGAYSLVNPATGESVRIDAAVNERLHPFGYAFYRPFSDRALKAWDVFRFGASRCKGDFLTILLMGAAGGLLGLLTPIITGEIFNRVIPGAERIQLGHMIAALLVCAVATALFQLVRGLAVLRVESKMDASVQSAVWDRLVNLPTSFFRRFAAGELAVRAGGISAIRQLLSGAAVSSLLSGLFSAFNLGLLFYYDAGLALWAVGVTMLALAVMFGATWAQLSYLRDVAERQSRLSGQVLQYITGITKLRVAGAETKSFERWARDFTDQRRLQYRARRIGNGLTTFSALFPVLSMMVIFGVMIGREDAVMATGDFIAFSGAFGTFTTNMLGMTGAFVAILMAIPIYEQARPILEALPEIDESKADPGDLSGAIEVEHVSFRYDEDGPMILHDVSLRARAGEFVAFVGPSGSGKSTILRLLLGFETPESGSIYYDGQDLAGLDIQSVRRKTGVVLQNGSLMSGDLFTNITGSSPATMDDAWEAARMAGLDEDIKQMPMGMHTVVSEGGTTLSGGQRQRLLIARAVVNRPRILFFDEATSALDNRTQAVVSESLDTLQATRIVVAHRLSTIINADRIYVLDQGRVVQEGTYETLLEEGGLFAELVRRQMA